MVAAARELRTTKQKCDLAFHGVPASVLSARKEALLLVMPFVFLNFVS